MAIGVSFLSTVWGGVLMIGTHNTSTMDALAPVVLMVLVPLWLTGALVKARRLIEF